MVKGKNLLILIISINLIDSKIAEWEEIVKQDGFFSRLLDQNFVLVLSSTENNQKKILRDLDNLQNRDFVKENNVDLVFLDSNKTSFFKKHYDLETDTNLFFFTRNQLVVLENFQNLSSEENILETVSDFVEKNIKSVSIQLKNLDQVENLVENKKMIGIYLGAKNENYNSFYNLAIDNIDFNFYFSSDEELKEKIYKRYSLEDTPKNDTFVILRHQELITDFDQEELVSFDKLSSDFEIDQFFKYERYPKLRDCSFNSLNVDNLFLKREKMLLFITDENDDNEEKNNNIFYESLKMLPKRLIYSKCDIQNDNMNHYLTIFMRGGHIMEPNKIYIVYASLSNKIKVTIFDKDFNTRNITNFVFEFYQKNRSQFEEVKQEEFKEEEI